MKSSCNPQRLARGNANHFAAVCNGGSGMATAHESLGGVPMDILYVTITIGFFALSWGLIVLCEKL